MKEDPSDGPALVGGEGRLERLLARRRDLHDELMAEQAAARASREHAERVPDPLRDDPLFVAQWALARAASEDRSGWSAAAVGQRAVQFAELAERCEAQLVVALGSSTPRRAGSATGPATRPRG